MQALVITGVTKSGALVATETAPPKSNQVATNDRQAVVQVNPIAQVCAELAKTLFEKYENKNSMSALEPISIIMGQLDCKKSSLREGSDQDRRLDP
jgi:hypothetical protein